MTVEDKGVVGVEERGGEPGAEEAEGEANASKAARFLEKIPFFRFFAILANSFSHTCLNATLLLLLSLVVWLVGSEEGE